MNKKTEPLKSRRALVQLIIFLLMIIPALFLFLAARDGWQSGMGVLLAVVILANLASIFC